MNASLWMVYGIVLEDAYIGAPNGLGVGLSLIQLGCIGGFGRRKELENEILGKSNEQKVVFLDLEAREGKASNETLMEGGAIL